MQSRPVDVVAAARSPIAVRDPATGRVVGEVPNDAPEVVAVRVARARAARPAWEAMGTTGRARALRAARKSFVGVRRELVDLLGSETGKPVNDVVGEVFAVCLDIRSALRFAPRALRPEPVGTRLPRGKKRIVRHVPYGVVGVIGPWNAPLTLTLGDAVHALAAGNTVVVKPSEATPLAVRRAVEALASALPPDVLACVTGDGQTGAALVDQVDMVAVTGSPETGRRVMERAARRLVPVLLELGGKDPMIVLEDAPLERAVNAAVWGGFFMTGQVCMSIERIYVVDAIADEFVRRLVDRVRLLRVGPNTAEVELGPLTTPRQVEIVAAQVEEAVRDGATALVGGHRLPELGEQFYAPTVLVDVRPTMRVMNDETFGPVVAVQRVRDAEEAIALANATPFGLNASVWTTDLARGRAVAERIEAGSACVNDCILNAGDADLPFGGVKQSGVGSRHGGVDGVRVFTRPQALRIDRGRHRKDAPWFPYRRKPIEWALRVMGWLWG